MKFRIYFEIGAHRLCWCTGSGTGEQKESCIHSTVFSLKNWMNEMFPSNLFWLSPFRTKVSGVTYSLHFLTFHFSSHFYLVSAYYHSAKLLLIISPMAAMFLNPMDTFLSFYFYLSIAFSTGIHCPFETFSFLAFLEQCAFLIFCNLSGCSFYISFSGSSSNSLLM